MTTEADNNEAKSSKTKDAEPTGKFPICGPGCGCGDSAGKINTKLKILICLVVFVAVCGILLFKTSSARQNTSDMEKSGFSNPYAKTGQNAPVNSAEQQGGSGAAVPAISALNTVAAKLDTVFLLIPSKDKVPTAKETGAVLAAVERTLNEKGLNTGIFTLQTDSPDYPNIAAKVSTPGIAVLTKGRGIGFVSGGITETSLMLAYVSSTRGGGCGSKGCPLPADGSAAAPCN